MSMARISKFLKGKSKIVQLKSDGNGNTQEPTPSFTSRIPVSIKTKPNSNEKVKAIAESICSKGSISFKKISSKAVLGQTPEKICTKPEEGERKDEIYSEVNLERKPEDRISSKPEECQSKNGVCPEVNLERKPEDIISPKPEDCQSKNGICSEVNEQKLEDTCLEPKVRQSSEKMCPKPKPELEQIWRHAEVLPPFPMPIPTGELQTSNEEVALVPVFPILRKTSPRSPAANFPGFPAITMKPLSDPDPPTSAPVTSVVPYAVQDDYADYGHGNEPSHGQERLPSFQTAVPSSARSSPSKTAHARPRALPSAGPLTTVPKSGKGGYVNLYFKKKTFDKMCPGSHAREHAVEPYTPPREPTPPPSDQVRFSKVVTEYEIITEIEEGDESVKRLKQNKINSGTKHSTPAYVEPSATSISKKSIINRKTGRSKSPKSVTISEEVIPPKSNYLEGVREADKVNNNQKQKKRKTVSVSTSPAPPPLLEPESSLPPPPEMPSAIPDQSQVPDDDDYKDTPSAELVPPPSVKQVPNVPIGDTDRSSRSKIPRVVLPGHGNPHLARPSLKSPTRNSSSALFAKHSLETPPPTTNVSSQEKVCKKCGHWKGLLNQADETIQYLNQLLKVKEKEVKDLITSKNLITAPPSTNSWETRDRSTNTSQRESILAINPLLAKLLTDEPDHKSANRSPRGGANSTTTCAIPKFDLDEFILKFLKHSILLSEAYSNSTQIDPFEYAQIFRAALAARDCLAQAVKQKLKHGYHTLKRQYELLMTLRSASNDRALPEEYFLKLVDSHRRFVRFIYYFLKTSVEEVEKFEQNFIPLQRRTPATHPMKYSKETKMTIDGVRYSGVFIPLSEIEKDNVPYKKNKSHLSSGA